MKIFFLLIFCLLFSNNLEAKEERYIKINLPAFRLQLIQGDTIIREYPVGIGTAYNHTPTGETHIINRLENPTYYPRNWQQNNNDPIPPGEQNPVGTRWMGLSWPHYGIHGTNSPDSIGRIVSQGCIRMHNRDVEELFNLVQVGTRVEIVYDLVEITKAQDGKIIVTTFPDIYNRGLNLFAEAEQKLADLGLTDKINAASLWNALNKEDELTGINLPYALDFKFGSKTAEGFRDGFEMYVPWDNFLENEISSSSLKEKIIAYPFGNYISLNVLIDSYEWVARMINPTLISLQRN